jgi:hypothetical protein
MCLYTIGPALFGIINMIPAKIKEKHNFKGELLVSFSLLKLENER